MSELETLVDEIEGIPAGCLSAIQEREARRRLCQALRVAIDELGYVAERRSHAQAARASVLAALKGEA